jgi:hypothetical protein
VDEDEGGGGYEGEGGFLEGGDDYGAIGAEEGGFEMDNQDGDAGGFLPDNDDNGESHIPSSSKPRSKRPIDTLETDDTRRIPLSKLPKILQSLNLPTDEDVLAVFRNSASGWADDDIEEPRLGGTHTGAGEGEEDGVLLKDFRAVCAALMDPEEDTGGDVLPSDDNSDEDDEDMFRDEGDGDSSDLSDVSEESYGKTSKAEAKGKGKKTTSNEPKTRGKRKDWREITFDGETEGVRVGYLGDD